MLGEPHLVITDLTDAAASESDRRVSRGRGKMRVGMLFPQHPAIHPESFVSLAFPKRPTTNRKYRRLVNFFDGCFVLINIHFM